MAKTTTLQLSGFFNNTLAALRYKTPLKFSNIQPEQRTINLEEVSCHDTPSDCWIVIYDRVYDITDFLNEHPGGNDILLEHAGRDASFAFEGTGHSSFALKLLEKFLIGDLPESERIFRKIGGIRFSNSL